MLEILFALHSELQEQEQGDSDMGRNISRLWVNIYKCKATNIYSWPSHSN